MLAGLEAIRRSIGEASPPPTTSTPGETPALPNGQA